MANEMFDVIFLFHAAKIDFFSLNRKLFPEFLWKFGIFAELCTQDYLDLKPNYFNGPESVKILAIIFSHKPLVFTIIIVNFASVLNLNDDDIKRAD